MDMQRSAFGSAFLPVPEELAGQPPAVLIVDDEQGIRSLLQSVVGGMGFRVLCAEDGKDALRLNRLHMITIHLAILDISLPDVSGLELATILKFHHPAIKVLYTSGFPEDHFVDLAEPKNRIVFLQKPFTPMDVASKVKTILAMRR